jgi:DNA-binding PadR family transcriptional regulator
MAAKGPSLHIEFKGLLSFLILHELSRERLFGDRLAERIGSRKGEKLTPGTIYPALKKLRRFKLVKFSRDGRRKVYSLTPEGKMELRKLYGLFGRYFRGLARKVRKA